MKIIVTYVYWGIESYPDLESWVRRFDLDPDNPHFDALPFFVGDPDILRCDGNVLYFFMVELNGIRYILTTDEPDDTEQTMLERFFSDDFRDSFHPSENTWEHFKRSPRAIAYRGGSGYFYSIWNYCD